jgi:protein SCO1/2
MKQKALHTAVLGMLTFAASGLAAGVGASSSSVKPVAISSVQYATPAVTMVRQDGQQVSLSQELDDGRPVVMNFIFTTCSSICPLISQTLAAFQQQLGAEAKGVHLVSISIDPEEDTPGRLREYASRFHPSAQWQYYTGTVAASLTAQRAFDVYRGDKMSHTPVTLMRAAPGKPWVRIEGFVTPAELVHDYRELVAHATE